MAATPRKTEKETTGLNGMTFMPKGTQYRVSTPDLSKVDQFPYVFRWDKPEGKNIAISKVITTLMDPCDGEMEVNFKVSCRRESFNRVFRSFSDIVRSCDKVENQFISQNISDVNQVVKAYFECIPPIILERANDSVEVSLNRKISAANGTYVMCEGWTYECSETTVRDIMHTPLYVREDTSVYEAARLMSEKEVGSVLSVDKNGEVTGVFTERDVLKKVAGVGLDPCGVSIKQVASSPVTTVESWTSIDGAAELMAKNHIRRLPVVEDASIIGIVTDRDLIRAIPAIFKRGL